MPRVWEVAGGFGLDQLKQTERDPEPLGPGQVRVKMEACAINFRDLLMVEGKYDPRQSLPLIPLSDGVGEVTEVGAGVTRVAVGDRVAGCFAPKWLTGTPTRERLRTTLGGPLDGMLAEERVLDAEGVVRVPSHLSAAQAATLPCAGLTAWSALSEEASVRAGDTILVQGTGGVSIFALQLGVLLGARVIVTSSSDEKLAKARAMGAYETINYKTDESWGKTAASHTSEGVDLVVEVGGAGTLDQSLRAVRTGGTIAMIGILAGAKGAVPLTKILMRQVRVQGILVGHREGFEAMNRAIGAHGLEPVVDRTFAFDEAVEAFHYLKSGVHFGKVAVTF